MAKYQLQIKGAIGNWNLQEWGDCHTIQGSKTASPGTIKQAKAQMESLRDLYPQHEYRIVKLVKEK
ncbi:hypothetical protein D3C77_34530 [compost metagenome]